MNPQTSAATAVKQFPPQLVQLVQADASDSQLQAEGFTSWEIHAVRTLVKRAGSSLTTAGAARE